MDGFIPKPVRSQELYQTIAAVLSRSGASSSAPWRTEKPLFNREAMLARLGGDQELFQELVQLFMEECPRLLESARQAIRDRDAQTLRTATHTMRGSVSYMDAREVQQAAQRLEELACRSALSDAAEAFRDLEEAVERLLTVLRGERATRAAG
jgi:HPt (histidine-containing phosphotransfer) domain-containing protein